MNNIEVKKSKVNEMKTQKGQGVCGRMNDRGKKSKSGEMKRTGG